MIQYCTLVPFISTYHDSITGKGFSYLLQRRKAVLYADIRTLSTSWKGCYNFKCIDLDAFKSFVKYEGSEPCSVDTQDIDEPYSFDNIDSCSDSDESIA